MTKTNRKPETAETRRDVRELTAEEVGKVSGGGLLTSPIMGVIGRPRPINPGGGLVPPGTVVTP